ncbi:MAG: tRNA (guanosine(37)-N1)-methyltransferase TrmD [Armatimonadota bacterium]|nr:tRNA (guanosine(37)-N1)-methyltransferase TrmD [Armatimonadota bacterium]MDR7439882.1 tRNA (guanosine(37)-N1)-methyltransferase TrmD [Armatimonadota bacterium]MDR7563323.1 tRNA (guanosine(37)-N1)-methyltransferase TrmD [Armatimonadota bacterium]MDR7567477.1 tRNA (guanosine(37)-N1)-methyltransferase TrmD [Armatimonadota bacterium]MDR7601974.1 tRNA (guanosine(37)-N1)-methyltransferase TrmD [Armatimonadota bacterium]
MRVDIVTIFPEIFLPLRVGVLGRAQERGVVQIKVWNLRDFATGRHRTVDDYPYGGGPGMVMKPEPFFAAAEAIERDAGDRGRILLTSPQGRRFDQRMAYELSREGHLVILCGRYEGVDERVVEGLPAEEVSIGDYVLTGGELAAMVIVDATARLHPGVVGDEASVREDSFVTGLLDHPHYTRPAEFRGMRVPEVLLRGNHAAIARWRRKEALRRTLLRRPDLLRTAELTPEDRALLREIEEELGTRV